jgi:hypothetical protein
MMIRFGVVPAIVQRTLASCALGFVLALPAPAFAHPLVDEGERLYEEADFVGALDALGRAESASDLSLSELVHLFETRALVHLAMSDAQAMERDLERVVALEPDHRLGPSAHPDVQRALAQVRADSAVTIEAHVENDWARLVRGIRLRARADSEGTSWSEEVDAPLLVQLEDGQGALYYAEALGPGGTVLASAGTEAEPLHASASGGGIEAWPFIVAGVAAAVVAGAVVAAVLLWPRDEGVSTQPQAPVVRF